MYNLNQELEFCTPRRRYVCFKTTRGLQLNIVGKVPQQNQPYRRKNSSSPGYVGLLRDFALTHKENWMSENTVVLDSLVEDVRKKALVTLRGHLEEQGIGQEALRLLDNVVILTEDRYVVKAKEPLWEGVAENIPATLAMATRDMAVLCDW